eukprot:TRINITY_DN7265_c0_g1_i2.p1 TRINITY_DN7265_c0_g1~~TRINITY_DN7265_c0_g1_i2.p1  ORF type:complete len:479 (-),score=112.72 TRINITY_DN7265_c0_g1_i2:103-1539(-)
MGATKSQFTRIFNKICWLIILLWNSMKCYHHPRSAHKQQTLSPPSPLSSPSSSSSSGIEEKTSTAEDDTKRKQIELAEEYDLMPMVRLLYINNDYITSTVANEFILSLHIDEFTGTLTVSVDAILSIRNLIKNHTNDRVINACLYSLERLVQEDEQQTCMIYNNAGEVLFEMMNKHRGDILCSIISLIGSMSSVEDVMEDLVYHKKFHRIISGIFPKARDSIVKRQILSTLNMLVNVDNIEHTVDAQLTNILISVISNDDEDKEMRKSALQLLTMICLGEEESSKKLLLQQGIIHMLLLNIIPSPSSSSSSSSSLSQQQQDYMMSPTAIKKLPYHHCLDLNVHRRKNSPRSDKTEQCKPAIMALCGLCSLEEGQREVMKAWGIDRMIESIYLHISDEHVILAIVMALNSLCDDVKIIKRIREHPSCKATLANIIETIDNLYVVIECRSILQKCSINNNLNRCRGRYADRALYLPKRGY